MVAYFSAGGLLAAACVNLLELAVLVVGFLVAVPFAWQAAGGWPGLAARGGARLRRRRTGAFFGMGGAAAARPVRDVRALVLGVARPRAEDIRRDQRGVGAVRPCWERASRWRPSLRARAPGHGGSRHTSLPGNAGAGAANAPGRGGAALGRRAGTGRAVRGRDLDRRRGPVHALDVAEPGPLQDVRRPWRRRRTAACASAG